MSAPTNDGGPAFPMTGEECHNLRYSQPGMTLRDYFAGQALAGIMSGKYSSNAEKWVPEEAYKIADGMIAVRFITTKS